MLIEATDEEMKEMTVLAIKSSHPMGLGYLHYNPNLKLSHEDIEIKYDNNIHIDYYQGRMVKFYAKRLKGNHWEVPDNLSSNYQSWTRDYPTWDDLLNAARNSIRSEGS